MLNRLACGEGYVCSVLSSVQYGTGRLKDDGAPPFFSAIGRQYLIRPGHRAPKKIVAPIAAYAVATRSLTRPVPHRGSLPLFHSSGGNDDVLPTHQRTAGRAVGEYQRQGNPPDPARTRRDTCEDGKHEGGTRYGHSVRLNGPSVGGGGASPALLPPPSGYRHDRFSPLVPSDCRTSGCRPCCRWWQGVKEGTGGREHGEGASRDKRGAGTHGCEGRISALFAYGTRCDPPYTSAIYALFSTHLRMAPRP